MTREQRRATEANARDQATTSRWGTLSWDHVAKWAGERSLSRGRAYQRQGRVLDLVASEEDGLLATVLGRDRYSAAVWWEPGKNGRNALRSRCTCPVGGNACKHAVAVVSAYLKLLAQQAPVPAADPDDPRWASLPGDAPQTAGDAVIADSEEEAPDGPRTRPSPRNSGDEKIRRHIEAQSREELAELVWSLATRFPELRDELRERIAVGAGDVERLVAQARQELRRVTSEAGVGSGVRLEGLPAGTDATARVVNCISVGDYEKLWLLGLALDNSGNVWGIQTPPEDWAP